MGPLRGLGLVSVGLGLSLLADARRRSRDAARRAHRMVRTKGTVVRLRHDEDRNADGERTTFYYPTVRFTTVDGEAIEVERDWGSSWAPPEGAQVDVFFEPERPRSAMIGSPDGGTPSIHLMAGAILAVVGAAFAIAFP